ncbi:MAG: hypothetical protein J0H21_05785 [Rhizobiales bacterium]|nr:hypothetical protein [Hyphomicrobiales bacterium]
MTSVYDLKPRFQALLRPLVGALVARGVTANQVTIAAILTEFVGVLVEALGAGRRYDGPMGKSDRAAVIGAIAFLVGLGVPAGWWLDGIMLLLTLLAVWTSFNRARHALVES